MKTGKPTVTIDYCTGCRWMLRAAWTAQELLATFENELGGVTLRPAEAAGTFDVWVGDEPVWRRREAGGFPELKVLKQLVRDRVASDRDLGHSDR